MDYDLTQCYANMRYTSYTFRSSLAILMDICNKKCINGWLHQTCRLYTIFNTTYSV